METSDVFVARVGRLGRFVGSVGGLRFDVGRVLRVEFRKDFGEFDAFAGGAFDGVDRSSGTAASRFVDFAIGEASR